MLATLECAIVNSRKMCHMPIAELLTSSQIPAELRRVIAAAPLPGLASEPTCDQIHQEIAELATGPLKPLVEAGLWLLAGDLESSHAISQTIHDRNGSFWHGIMHRREGDFWNAKYWFRKVGPHPVLKELAELVAGHSEVVELYGKSGEGLTRPEIVAETLVDLCELASTKDRSWGEGLQQLCWWEWQLLFKYSWEA